MNKEEIKKIIKLITEAIEGIIMMAFWLVVLAIGITGCDCLIEYVSRTVNKKIILVVAIAWFVVYTSFLVVAFITRFPYAYTVLRFVYDVIEILIDTIKNKIKHKEDNKRHPQP